jgi:hypothetical protein
MAIRFRVPGSCPKCESRGGVRPVTTVTASRAKVTWECGACGHEWDIAPGDHDRRAGPVDRRRVSRSDRRKRHG